MVVSRAGASMLVQFSQSVSYADVEHRIVMAGYKEYFLQRTDLGSGTEVFVVLGPNDPAAGLDAVQALRDLAGILEDVDKN